MGEGGGGDKERLKLMRDTQQHVYQPASKSSQQTNTREEGGRERERESAGSPIRDRERESAGSPIRDRERERESAGSPIRDRERESQQVAPLEIERERVSR